jgi:hypothetical protein
MVSYGLGERQLQVLRLSFLVFVLLGVGVRAVEGGSLLESVVGGGVIGGLAFLPVALCYLVFLIGTRRVPKRA